MVENKLNGIIDSESGAVVQVRSDPSIAERLSVGQVYKHRGGMVVLSGVTFSVRAGQIVALLGPSGSGKTTIGEIITGILPPDSGTISIDGRDVTQVPAHLRRIPLAPQDWELFPHLTALENVAFGLKVAGVNRSDRRRRSIALLEEVGLAHKLAALPHQLSGGQQQRVCFARALAVPSQYVIVDEPFANVDQDTRTDLRRVLADVADRGRGVLFITHDRLDALQLADEVVCLVGGRVAMNGTPQEVYSSPASLDVALLTGDAFLLPVPAPSTGGFWNVGAASPEGPYAVLARPEWLMPAPSPQESLWNATITAQVYQGDGYAVEFETRGWRGRLNSVQPCAIGATLSISARPEVTLRHVTRDGLAP